MAAPKKKLILSYHGRIIDHLGIQMYQSPVAAIAELVANAWDAEATEVRITLPPGKGGEIVIEDNGFGMTFDECQARYLNVGYGRRGKDASQTSGVLKRPVLGRKGIGKFAGFGIARIIDVETISKSTGELTKFELDYEKLRGGDEEEYVATNAEIPVLKAEGPDPKRKDKHRTVLTLKSLTFAKRPNPGQFAQSLARRYLLHQRAADFKVFVDGKPLPADTGLEKVQFAFPKDYAPSEVPASLKIENEWGVEMLPGGKQIRWRVLFDEDPIEDEELRGVAIFCRGKLAQTPFFFNLTGGLGGQFGQEYLSGQVEADYLDALPNDVIAPERQRIRWEDPAAQVLLEWGQKRTEELMKLWKERRGADRLRQITQKLAPFAERLARLPTAEQTVISSALRKLAGIARLKEADYLDLGDAIMAAWEGGRLRDLIRRIAGADDLTDDTLIEILLEARVLTALHLAEAVKVKLEVVAGLKEAIENRSHEVRVRDYIAKNPELIAPRWETFRKETSVKNLLVDAATESGLAAPEYEGRIDLALSSGQQLLILEFMRPRLKVDWDHLNRFVRYIQIIRTRIRANTAGPFTSVIGYLVADGLAVDAALLEEIARMKRDDMFAQDWPTLLGQSVNGWRDFLEILADRAGGDPRLKALMGDV